MCAQRDYMLMGLAGIPRRRHRHRHPRRRPREDRREDVRGVGVGVVEF